jgi:hypothetical protein
MPLGLCSGLSISCEIVASSNAIVTQVQVIHLVSRDVIQLVADVHRDFR